LETQTAKHLPEGKDRTQLEPASWLRLYGDYLYSIAVMKVGDRATAEDLVQEVFVSAIKAKDSFKGESSEKTWLVAILKNKVIDYYRKKDVLKGAAEFVADTEDDPSVHFFDQANGHWLKSTSPQDWPDSADRQINTVEFEQTLQMCIQKMPAKMIPVFVARFIDEEDSETICKVQGISSSNYWVMIHRAKVLIRHCLEKNWFLTKMLK
jgi:RNA polymerase sigma-70 factor (TIGR02943 family)